MSHLHQFFGNRSTAAGTTPSLLRKHRITTCLRGDELRGGPRADGSAYWVPVLFVGEREVEPTQLGAYYTSRPRRYKMIRPFPPKLRMIAGDASGRTGPGPGPIPTYYWYCGGAGVRSGTREAAPLCATPDLRLDISFPDCWNGRTVDSRDHKSHMAYSQQLGRGPEFVCPPSHPVLVPRLRIQVRYPTTGGPLVKLASGPIYTAHADFMNGWNRSEMRKLVRRCLNADKYCGGEDRPVPGHE